MTHLLLDWSDGHYSTRPIDAEEAKRLEDQGHDVAHVEDRVYEAWKRHCEDEGMWQALWRSIENEKYVRRREKELLPLEAADVEIRRLRAELERVQRTANYFQDEWEKASGLDPNRWHTAEARSANGYACVFPKPGCEVEVLPHQWQQSARKILGKYNEQLAAEGLIEQGCCCGSAHRKLDAATVQQLRNAGFLVEHDTEVEESAT